MVKVYYGEVTFLQEEAAFEQRLSLVDENRRRKVLRCRQPMDRCRTLGAGLLLRQGLLREGLDYDSLAFGEEEAGKPFLLQKPDLHFNLSHSGAYAAAAFGESSLGVDLEGMTGRFYSKTANHRDAACSEEIENLRDTLERVRRMGRRILTEPERRYLEGLEAHAYLWEFTRIWTRKEAWAKALGLGLKMDFVRADTLGEEFICSQEIEGDYWLSVCQTDEDGQIGNMGTVVWEKIAL